jgi:hypothetical protein
MKSSFIGLLCLLWCSGCRYDSLIAVHYHAAQRPVAQTTCTTQPAEETPEKTVAEIVKEHLR